MKIFIPYEKKRRYIGKIENGIFQKDVKTAVHLFNNLDAWGIDKQKFYDVILPNATVGVQIYDKQSKYYYRTPIRVFEKFCIKLEEYRGHREQVFLPREYFTKLRYKDLKFEIISEPCLEVKKFLDPENYQEPKLKL